MLCLDDGQLAVERLRGEEDIGTQRFAAGEGEPCEQRRDHRDHPGHGGRARPAFVEGDEHDAGQYRDARAVEDEPYGDARDQKVTGGQRAGYAAERGVERDAADAAAEAFQRLCHHARDHQSGRAEQDEGHRQQGDGRDDRPGAQPERRGGVEHRPAKRGHEQDEAAADPRGEAAACDESDTDPPPGRRPHSRWRAKAASP